MSQLGKEPYKKRAEEHPSRGSPHIEGVPHSQEGPLHWARGINGLRNRGARGARRYAIPFNAKYMVISSVSGAPHTRNDGVPHHFYLRVYCVTHFRQAHSKRGALRLEHGDDKKCLPR